MEHQECGGDDDRVGLRRRHAVAATRGDPSVGAARLEHLYTNGGPGMVVGPSSDGTRWYRPQVQGNVRCTAGGGPMPLVFGP
jgi:hypothetical protein